MDLTPAAEEVDALLRSSHRDYPGSAVFERDPALDRRIASAIALLARDTDIEYVSIDQSRASENGYVELNVFTTDHLIRAIVSHGYLTVNAVSRATVRSIEVVSSPDYLASEPDLEFSAVAHYKEISAKLPGDEYATDENLAKLREFFPLLLADL
jgi:hypothetical protein